MSASITKEAWFQTADTTQDVTTLFRQWEAGSLTNDQFKALMNKALGAQVTKARNPAASIQDWAKELAEARKLLGEVQEQIAAQSRMGDLPESRMMSDIDDLRGAILGCVDFAAKGSVPTHIDTNRMQRLAQKVFGKFFPGRELPNLQAPGVKQ